MKPTDTKLSKGVGEGKMSSKLADEFKIPQDVQQKAKTVSYLLMEAESYTILVEGRKSCTKPWKVFGCH